MQCKPISSCVDASRVYLKSLFHLVHSTVVNFSSMSMYLRMDPRCEKRTKHKQDVAGSSKRGRSSKSAVTHPPPPPHLHHHPSHSSEEDEDGREMFKIHSPIERTNCMPHKYSKKTKQEIINQNCGDPVYECSKQSSDPRFWSHFHADWYRSIYLYAKKPVVETKWVTWDWMATRCHTIFNQIKATCDELVMTKMMSFKYDWNNEIIYQFYSTLCFDADGQKLLCMTDGQCYEIIVRQLAHLLGLDHQLTIEPEAKIHTFNWY
jgi:hypothetical protein